MVKPSDLRFALYIPTLQKGGLTQFAFDVSSAFVDAGADVDVLTARSGEFRSEFDSAVRIVDVSGPSVVSRTLRMFVPVQVALGLGTVPSTVRYLRRTEPDCFISLQLSAVGIIAANTARADATTIIRESSTPSAASADPMHLVGHFAPHAKRLTRSLADEVVAISEGASRDIADLLDVEPDTIPTVYNPRYNARLRKKARAPVSHPWLDSDTPVVTSSGRFLYPKDFETVLRAFSTVRDTIDAKLLLLGDGQNRSSLEALAGELSIEDHVDFLGYVSNPHRYVARSDLYVFSSEFEGLGNALIEAIGVGTPAVAADCPHGPRETLLDGEGGWLVPVGDEKAMADAIQEAITDRELAEAKLARAHEKLDRFSPERVVEQYCQLAVK